jgi:hypothetical protein
LGAIFHTRRTSETCGACGACGAFGEKHHEHLEHHTYLETERYENSNYIGVTPAVAETVGRRRTG